MEGLIEFYFKILENKPVKVVFTILPLVVMNAF